MQPMDYFNGTSLTYKHITYKHIAYKHITDKHKRYADKSTNVCTLLDGEIIGDRGVDDAVDEQLIALGKDGVHTLSDLASLTVLGEKTGLSVGVKEQEAVERKLRQMCI